MWQVNRLTNEITAAARRIFISKSSNCSNTSFQSGFPLKRTNYKINLRKTANMNFLVRSLACKVSQNYRCNNVSISKLTFFGWKFCCFVPWKETRENGELARKTNTNYEGCSKPLIDQDGSAWLNQIIQQNTTSLCLDKSHNRDIKVPFTHKIEIILPTVWSISFLSERQFLQTQTFDFAHREMIQHIWRRVRMSQFHVVVSNDKISKIYDFFGVSVKSKATNDTFYIWDSISTHSRVNKAKPLFNQTVEMRNFTAAFFHMYVHAAWTRLTLIGWNSVTCYTATKIQLSVHFRFFADFRYRLPEHTKLIAFPESKLDPTVFLNELFYGRSRSILICKTTASNNLISKEA